MTRINRAVLTGFVLTSFFSAAAHANTYTAASCAERDVQTAVNQAASGDTVVIPSCPSGVTWGSNSSSDTALSVNAGITLIGQGAGNTVITDNIYKGNSNCQGGLPLIQVDVTTNVPWRISGFTLNGQTSAPNCGESDEEILASGYSLQFRVDDIVFNLGAVAGVNTANGVCGVIDHNTFNDPQDVFPVTVHHDTWQGVGYYGDNSWAQPDTFGTAQAVYIETNTFNFNTTGFPVGCFDSEEGGRLVFRFNTGCPFVGSHGLDSSGRYRSVRQWEIYENSFTSPPISGSVPNMYTAIFMRGGTGFVFNNAFNDLGTAQYMTLAQLNNYRSTSGYAPWGPSGTAEGCDGRGPFDTSTGKVYATFTASSSSSTDNTVASSSPGWTTNQWADSFNTGSIVYSLVDITLGWGSTIVSNTSNTIVTSGAAQAGQGLSHVAYSGDTMEILSSYPCADQIGRGAGAYISGTNGTGGAPTPVAPVNQASDPAYEWLNTYDGKSEAAFTVGGVGYYHVQPNRDYYAYNTSFSGTTGVGSGTLAERPSSCTQGVAYWATDQGSWNQSGSGGQGELYLCSATNTWSLYYQPYTYPNPLTQGDGPSPPTDLQAIAH
jgi:hypothetical protein